MAGVDDDGRLVGKHTVLHAVALARVEWACDLDVSRLSGKHAPRVDDVQHSLGTATPSLGDRRDKRSLIGRLAAIIDRTSLSRTNVQTAWDKASLNRITLHEYRHTYASLLMAAGYTIHELLDRSAVVTDRASQGRG